MLHQFRQLLGVHGAVGSRLAQVVQGEVQISIHPFPQVVLQAQEILCLWPALFCRSVDPFQRCLGVFLHAVAEEIAHPQGELRHRVSVLRRLAVAGEGLLQVFLHTDALFVEHP